MFIDKRTDEFNNNFTHLFKHYNNVWNQGIVPEHFWNEEKLKDNAIPNQKLYDEIWDLFGEYSKAFDDLKIRYVTRDSMFPNMKLIEFSFNWKNIYLSRKKYEKSDFYHDICKKQLEYKNLLVYTYDTDKGESANICSVKVFI